MELEISVRQFYDYFIKQITGALQNSFKEFKSIYKNCPAYTDFIKGIMSKYNKECLSQSVKYYPEYFTIDHTWWEVKPERKIETVNIYDWSFELAVEHENNWKDWTYEVEKLDSIFAKVKIVIGYMENSRRNGEYEIVESQRKNLKHLSNTDDFGVILLNKTLSNEDDPFDFRCYLLKTDGTYPISNKNNNTFHLPFLSHRL